MRSDDEKWNYLYTAGAFTALTTIGPQGLFNGLGTTLTIFGSVLLDFNGTLADQYFTLMAGGNSFGTTEGSYQTNVPFAGTLQRLWTNNDINTRTGGTADQIRSRINGVNGNLVATLTLSAPAEYEDTTNTDTIVAGDLVNLLFDVNATAGRSNNRNVRVELKGTHATLFLGNRDGLGNNDADTYLSIRGNAGRQNAVQDTETNMQHRSDIDFHWSNLWGNSVAGVTGTLVIRTRINAANGNQSITWVGASGEREDTTNTDSVGVGSLVNYFSDSTTASGIVNGLSSKASVTSAQEGGGIIRNRLRPRIFAPGLAR